MHNVQRSVLVPYSCEQMFNLVADIKSYPQFMPWCGGADILEEFENGVVASVTISIARINQSFTTRNTHDFPHSIQMDLVNGPFSHLKGLWRFIELAEDACKVEFSLDYSFNSRPLEFLVGPVFNKIANSFIDSFNKRAEQIYGEK
ncbi:type II toxin-antitoxin system RatA family toxin [Brackiella oedipodis]|uniref:type II toxin-antitoxin system RatA family toxin n=1 Tax=Brackiella oedipodis TaxID=124225 RepID=UPI00048CB6FC|nr:type II toxin-antitoxin system RatA family toxin [Brackiella oedipodis]